MVKNTPQFMTEQAMRDLCDGIIDTRYPATYDFGVKLPLRYTFADARALLLIGEARNLTSFLNNSIDYNCGNAFLDNRFWRMRDLGYSRFLKEFNNPMDASIRFYELCSRELEMLMCSNQGMINASFPIRNLIYDPRYNYQPSDFDGSCVSKLASDDAQSKGFSRMKYQTGSDNLEHDRMIYRYILKQIYSKNARSDSTSFKEYKDVSTVVSKLFEARGNLCVSPPNPYYDFRDSIIDYTCANIIEQEYQKQKRFVSDITLLSVFKSWIDYNEMKKTSLKKIHKSFGKILHWLYQETKVIEAKESDMTGRLYETQSDVFYILVRNFFNCKISAVDELGRILRRCKDDCKKKYILYIAGMMMDSRFCLGDKSQLSSLIRDAYGVVTPSIEADILDYYLNAVLTWGVPDYNADQYISIIMHNISAEGIKEFFIKHSLTADNFEKRKILFKNDIALFKACDVVSPELLLKCWSTTRTEAFPSYKNHFNPDTLQNLEGLISKVLAWCRNNDYSEYQEELDQLMDIYYKIFAFGRTKDDQPVMSRCDEITEGIIWSFKTPRLLEYVSKGKNNENIAFMKRAISREHVVACGQQFETGMGEPSTSPKL